MSRHKFSITELKDKLQTIQNQLDQEEQKLHCEIGAWVRQQTSVDSLKDLQDNFIIIPQKNKQQSEKVADKIFTSTLPTSQKNQSEPTDVSQPIKPQTKPDEDIFVEIT